MAPVGRRAVLAALASNLGVAATKLVGFVITGSASMLAETVHSIADSGNQALLLLGSKRAETSPSHEHPFGRGRERYFWAFIVGLVLFGLGGGFSMYEGVRKLAAGTHELSTPGFALALIAVAAAIEGFSFRTGIQEANKIRPERQGWMTFLRTTRNPEVTVVLLEDGAAMVGLGLAFCGITASWMTGDPRWDGIASVAIGAVLCLVAAFLTIEMKSLLIGETVPTLVALDLKRQLNAIEGIDRVLNMRTEHLGPDQVLVCVKVALRGPADLERVIEVIDECERVVHAVVPTTLTCYIEPDEFDVGRINDNWT